MNFEFIELEQIETLKTLEVLVSEVDVYVNQSKNYVRGYGIVSEWNEFLKETVKLSDFVPCGSDGLPMKEPKESDFNDVPNYKMALHRYKKAKQAVIFEGWESCIPLSHSIKNDKGYKITIYKKIGWCILDIPVHSEDSMYYSSIELPKKPTYSDLAKATIDNPLKFRK